MIDISKAIRDYLLTKPAVTALTSTRIYAERDVPPPAYKPSDGGAIVLKVRGGNLNYPATHADASLQFKFYALTEVLTNDLYLATLEALQDSRSGSIVHVQIEILGQALEEPNTRWPFVLAFFQAILVR